MICAFCAEIIPPRQVGNLRLSLCYKTRGYPKFKGKGAEVKALVPALLQVFTDLIDITKHEHRLIKCMLIAQSKL